MKEIINKVSTDFNLTKKLGKEVVESVIEGIVAEIQTGRLRVTGLGTFKVNERSARVGRNPKTGETIQVPAKKIVKFVQAKELTEVI